MIFKHLYLMDNLFRIPFEIKTNNLENLKYIFPISNNLDKIRFTDIGLYSTIFAISSEKIINKIKFMLNFQGINLKKLNCLDLGCCIGGIFYYLVKECNYTMGIDFEKIHIDICNNNMKYLYIKKNYDILLGNIENIFKNKKLNFSNIYDFQYNKFIPFKKYNKFNNFDLIYIGTPFIDLKFGNLKLIDLIFNIYHLYKPSIFLIQIPCSYNNEIHKQFYNYDLEIIFKKIKIFNYRIFIINDIKRNNKSYNLHILFIKNFKKIYYTNPYFKLKYHPELQNIFSKLINKFDIIYLINRYNCNFAWKPIYYNCYYINGQIKNKNLIIKCPYDCSKQIVIKYIKNFYSNNKNINFKYNRFKNEFYYIIN